MEVPIIDNVQIKKKIDDILNQTRLPPRVFHGILRSKGALLAGGSALYAFLASNKKDVKPRGDMDIYVNVQNAKQLLIELKPYLNNVSNLVAPAYDDSFMRKNMIVGRRTGVLAMKTVQERQEENFDTNIKKLNLDILIVNDKVENIVTNFDLTCCQVWWNGNELNGTNLPDTLNMKAKLRESYVCSLIVHHNIFLRSRLVKYKSLGFEISYENKLACEPKYQPRGKKQLSSVEEWVVKSLLKDIFGCNRIDIVIDMFEEKLDPFNMLALVNFCKRNPSRYLNFFNEAQSYLQSIVKGIDNHINVDICKKISLYIHSILKENYFEIPKPNIAILGESMGYVAEDLKNTTESLKIPFFDIIGYEDITNIKSFATESKTTVEELFTFTLSGRNQTCCFAPESLETVIQDIDNAWVFECKKENNRLLNYDIQNPYIGLPLASGKTLVPLQQLMSIYSKNNRNYILVEYKKIEFAASGKNALPHRVPNYVSADHCQAGTDKTIYNILRNMESQASGAKKIKKNNCEKCAF